MIGLVLTTAAAQAGVLSVPGTYATVQLAVDAATDGDVVEVAAGTFTGPVIIPKSRVLTIRGAGTADTTLRAGAKQGAVVVEAQAVAVLEELTITSDKQGRCLFTSGDLSLAAVTVAGCDAEREPGAGVFVASGGTLTAKSSQFADNVADSGAHIAIQSGAGAVSVMDSVLTSGQATRSGGAIQHTGRAALEIGGSELSDNEAGLYGGAIALSQASEVDIVGSSFLWNLAPDPSLGRGGALWAVSPARIHIFDSHFQGNVSHGAGALHIESVGDLQVTRTTFCDNESTMPWAPGPGAGAGGAVSVRDLVERALVTNSVFHVNRSDSGAGALWLIGSPVTMRHLTVVGNVAGKGWGAIDARGQSDVVLDNSLVAHTQGFGAWVADNTEAVGTYDAWWRNTAGPAEGPYEPGITHLFDPPLLQRTTDDCSTAQLWPTASSPLVDAIPYELDLDGSLADIGAYGGLKPLCELQEGYFADLDADGHGDPAAPVRGCDGATGVSLLPTDCDDARSDVSPDEEEVCGDGADNDCDGEVDEDCTDWIDTGTGTTWWTTDLTEEVTGPMDAFAGGGGCTCRHAGGASGWWLGALLLSLGRRSRRRARR